nr:hypothetical protein [Tanacetum cinerariifolium]
MSSITTQQTKLDLELVPKEKRLDIGKYNGRLNPRKIQREPTFQVVLDALAITPCYSAFLITTDFLEFKKPACPKLTVVLVSTKEPTEKSKRVKRPTKKSTQASTIGVVIRETPEIPVSKEKEKYEEVRKKSLRVFHKIHPSGSGTATKPTPSTTIIKLSVTNEGTDVKPGVLDMTEEESSKSETKSWGNDEDDNNNDQDSESYGSDQEKASDDDKTQSDNENK